MASSRKKQDEKNLKLLRDLASLPHNKYCFDCNQRGPTYVNVTIGSFVCTKCSGTLRGLTPPHRVKSISMAAFTPEEIDLLRSRGNDYCRRIWLGLYEGNTLSSSRDEQVVRDFMIEKYERKRYYLDPSSVSLSNGVNIPQSEQSRNKTSLVQQTKSSPIVNGVTSDRNSKNNNNRKINDFIADFGSADIYNAIDADTNKDNSIIKNNNNNNLTTQQQSFANFDNTLMFNGNIDSSTNCNRVDDWGFTDFDPFIDQTPIFAKSNINNSWNDFTFNKSSNEFQQQLTTTTTGPLAPSEDRYAALKDLDNALKSQPQIDWSSGSNGSSYGSPTPSSVYSSPSPRGSMYGSPSQGQFASIFMKQDPNNVSNPFNGGTVWGENGSQQMNVSANPFRSTNSKVNGMTSGFSISPFPATNGCNPWVPNPFTMGTSTNGHSSNPFL